MIHRLLVCVVALMLLSVPAGASAQVIIEDVPASGCPEVGDTVASLHYGDGVLDVHNLRMVARVPVLTAEGIVARASVNPDPSNQGGRIACLALGELVTGSTYTIVAVSEFGPYGRNDDPENKLRSTVPVACEPGEYSSLIFRNKADGTWIADRYGPDEVVITC